LFTALKFIHTTLFAISGREKEEGKEKKKIKQTTKVMTKHQTQLN